MAAGISELINALGVKFVESGGCKTSETPRTAVPAREVIVMNADQKPFVSVIMPALNEERYIEAAIRSVLPRAGSVDYELLVMDGGSTDRTEAIVAALSAETIASNLYAIRAASSPPR